MSINHTPPKPQRWILWVFLALGAFYLIAEHRVHLAGSLRWLPLGFLLLCPLMHRFMHGSHGRHDDDGKTDRPSDAGHTSMRDGATSKGSSDKSSGGH